MKQHIRFGGKEPSILQVPDDPEMSDNKIAELAELFVPREKDKGQISLWEASTDTEQLRVAAAFAARRKKKDKLREMRIPEFIFRNAQLSVEDAPDPESFACVAQLHKLLSTESEKTRERLARAIVEAFGGGLLSYQNLYQQRNNTEVSELVEEVKCSCEGEGESVDLTKAGLWIQKKWA